MVERFRNKPIIIEAIRNNGNNYEEIAGFVGDKCWVSRRMNAPVILDTLEGRMPARLGDWIIKGVKGQFYSCAEDIFNATYESVEEDE